MSRLETPAELLESMRRHAVETYPEECCGVMVGRSGAGGGRLVRLVPAANDREDGSRHNRFLIPPQTVLEAQRSARKDGLEILGYYHSHPNHPAVPSEFDREHAWPATSYLIVSVRAGAAAEARSWRLLDSRESFVEEELVELADAALESQ